MNRLLVLALFLCTGTFSFAQVKLQWITNLDASVNETSGLVSVGHRLITHNDSGGKATLYEIDSLTGAVVRTVYIANATNVDWEDVCADAQHIYIGDFGNNNGSRTNLKVYKVSIADYLSADTVIADTISFSYADQMDFTPSSMATKYDAEAIIAIGDSLYLFTKNWLDSTSSIYAIPKAPGSYSLPPIDSIKSPGLITAAHYDSSSNNIFLCGYIAITPFVTQISNVQFPITSSSISHTLLSPSLQQSRQVEAICMINNKYHLTAEASLGNGAVLYKLEGNPNMNLDENKVLERSVYPNPSSDKINLQPGDWHAATLYTTKGTPITSTKNNQIDASRLETGYYFLVLTDNEGQVIHKQKVIIK